MMPTKCNAFMKTPIIIPALIVMLFLASPSRTAAGTSAFDLMLGLPQLQTLQTLVPVGSNTVEVHLALLYNTKGQLSGTADSTVDGMAASCLGTISRRSTNVTYTLKIKASTVPATTITLRGDVGGLVSGTYAGPKGRTKIAPQPVTLTMRSPAPAHIDISSAVSARGQITGTANVMAYGTNGAAPGKLGGSVTTNQLKLTLTQAPRVISFKGVRMADVYVGTLKVTVPPDRETFTAYSVPASAFALTSGQATFRGTVLSGSNAVPAATAGVKVTVKSDLNGDGKFTGTEIVTATTDANGRYQITLPVSVDRTVMLELSLAGYAKFMTAYPNVTPGSVILKNATLQLLSSLNVGSGMATSDDGKITLIGLPGTINSMQARVFNPNTETAQFPGEFADNERNLLVSSVFSAIEAKDANGGAVTNLGTNATLCMQVPRDTWNTLKDLHPGNGQIDVPLYYYDESTGEWKRSSSDGWLENASHTKIAEAQLPAIQSGSYSENVFAAGPITHLSYWNIDWPISSHTCVIGNVFDDAGRLLAGASVSVKGLSYTGTSSPKVTGADGSFCSDILRSEGPGEDVDGNGITGETQQIQILVQSGTNYFSFGPFDSPQLQGTCDDGGRLHVDLMLNDSNRLAVSFCTVTGQVVYSGTTLSGTNSLHAGDPIAGAVVFGFDPEAFEFLTGCQLSGTCLPATTADDGTFTLTAPVLAGLTVYSTKFDVTANGYDYFQAVSSFSGCPPGAITLSADFTGVRFLILDLAGVGVDSAMLSLVNDLPVVSISTATAYYFGTSLAPQSPPVVTGDWLTLPLRNGVDNTAAGTITFTVTSLAPVAGTWTTSTVGLSGTFTQETF